MSYSPPHNFAISNLQSPILMGLANLMTRVFKGEDLTEVANSLLARAQQDDANSLLDLSVLLQLQGNKDTGLSLQKEALSQQQLFTLYPDTGSQSTSKKLKLLAIYTHGDLMTNTPLEFLAQGADFTLQILYVAAHLPLPLKLPEHDIAIVAVSELDRNIPCLPRIDSLLANCHSVVLNKPASIAKLSRDAISKELQNTPGVSIPLTHRLTRNHLLVNSFDGGIPAIDLPFIIRPIDSHAGNQLAKIESRQELSDYFIQCHDAEFFVSAFVDYKSLDGMYKKYRIMVIDGKPFIAHMAISDHWMIHYLNAGMMENAEKRFAEAQAMGRFEQDFAQKHQHAFSELTQKIGLDYYGLDCAETATGELLIFEACASLNVHAMDCEKIFPYKKVQMQKIFDAFHQMLINKSGFDNKQ